MKVRDLFHYKNTTIIATNRQIVSYLKFFQLV